MTKRITTKDIETKEAHGPVLWRLKVSAPKARTYLSLERIRGGRPARYDDAAAYMTGRSAAVLSTLSDAGAVSALMRWNRSTATSPVRPWSDYVSLACDPAHEDRFIEAIEALLVDREEKLARSLIEDIEAARLRTRVCAYMSLSIPA